MSEYLPELGRFSEDGRSYTILSSHTPHGWTQFLYNNQYLVSLDVGGRGMSSYRRPGGLWTRLIFEGRMPRRIYLRDQEDGTIFYMPGSEGCEFTIGAALAQYKARFDGLEVTMSVSVPGDFLGEAWRVSVRNTGERPRKLLLTGFFPLTPTGYPTNFGYTGSIYIEYHEELGGVFFDNHDPDRPDPLYNAYMIQDAPVQSFDTSSATFIGKGSIDEPDGLAEGKLPCRINCGGASKLAALASEHALAAGEQTTVQFLIGVAGDTAEVAAIRKAWFEQPEAIASAAERSRRYYRSVMDRQQVSTPDPEFDRLVNHWLGYNLCFTARWTRLYSRGFRDCIQDTQGASTLEPDVARANFLEAMPHVYRSGRCRRSWAAVGGALKDQYYADQPVWVAPAMKTYLAETADTGLLEEVSDYYDGGSSTVWEHLVACQRHLYEDRGEHGLCLIHEGDWCDTAHRLGIEGRGEGVWLSIAYHKSLLDFMAIAEWLGRDEELRQARKWAEEIRAAINEHGWDGDWFLIAYNDYGRPIGTAADEEGRIFLNPQSWSVIGQATSLERQQRAMAAVDEHLDSWVGPHLLYPPYTKPDPTIGSLTGFHPGTCENGPCYCHAASFKIVADCMLGRGEKAFQTFRTIMPGGDADRRVPEPGCPPFAFVNGRVAAYHPYHAGEHGGAWATGTVSWCFQAAGQYILGVRPDLEGLRIDPCVPPDWQEFSVSRLYRGARYHVHVRNPNGLAKGVREVTLDGRRIEGNLLPPQPAGGEHQVEALM